MIDFYYCRLVGKPPPLRTYTIQSTSMKSFAHHVRACLRRNCWFLFVVHNHAHTHTCWWCLRPYLLLWNPLLLFINPNIGRWLAGPWSGCLNHDIQALTPVEAPIKNTFIHFDEQQPDSVLWWQSGSNVVEKVWKVVSQTDLFKDFIVVRKQKDTQISTNNLPINAISANTAAKWWYMKFVQTMFFRVFFWHSIYILVLCGTHERIGTLIFLG